jgi:carboxyl-terminal processing protease
VSIATWQKADSVNGITLVSWPQATDHRAMRRAAIVVLQTLVLLGLAACGDDDAPIVYQAGVFEPSAAFAARCENPRLFAADPWTGTIWTDRKGSALHEKHFLRSWTNELYLWFDEVIDRNPLDTGGSTGGVAEYFGLLRTTALTASGQPKDRFHFTYDTKLYRQQSSSGVVLGHGISWSVVSATPPRELRVEYVQAGTEAAADGVQRGATLLTLDGIDVVNETNPASVELINSILFRPAAASTHTMVFRDRGGTSTRAVSLAAANIAFDAVPATDVFNLAGTAVGYLLFNDHTAAAEAELKAAVEDLAAAGIDELVLDLRYNGGGFLDIASQLAYMIAGPAVTAGRAFERLQFNSKYPSQHPLTGQPIQPLPFLATTRNFSRPSGQPLPSLDLARVYVLTSGLTCSASESIINGLRGVGIEVIQIGGDTCGKPYGFYARDNCGTTYFSIQFRGVNDVGFGDYVEGFSATRVLGQPQANLPGCAASDDFTRELGDPEEGQLQTALTHLQTGACPVTPLQKAQSGAPAATRDAIDSPLALRKPAAAPWRDNRILR